MCTFKENKYIDNDEKKEKNWMIQQNPAKANFIIQGSTQEEATYSIWGG
jgi:hypothetical protein